MPIEQPQLTRHRIAALVDRNCRLMDHPWEREVMGLRARDEAVREFAAESMARNMIAVHDESLRR